MAARGGARFRGRRSCAAAPVLLGPWLTLLSCGHAEPPPVVPAPRPVPQPEARALPEPLTPLELSADVVLVGRLRDPRALLTTLGDLAGPELALEHTLSARLGTPRQQVDLGAPIELLVRLDARAQPPALSWAISLGLEDTPAGRRAVARGPVDVPSPLGLSCAEASSLGPRGIRMVCAASDPELASALPLATRALPVTPLSAADVAVALRTNAACRADDEHRRLLISSWLAEALGVPSMNARFDAQFAGLSAALTREVCDLGADLDGTLVAIDVAPHAAGVRATLSVPPAPHRSALAELVLGGGAAGLAPTDFWYAHAESEGAGFIWALSAGPIERWRRPLAELLGTALDYRGVPRALRLQASYLLESLPLPRGPVVLASGALPLGEGRQHALARERLGWQLYVVRGSFAEYQYYAGELVKAWSDPVLGPQLNRLLRAALGPASAPERLRQRRPVAGSRLPRGAFTLEIAFAASAVSAEDVPDGGDEPQSLFVVAAPDEDGVKIAWGADEKFLASLLMDPERIPASTTLASRPGLGALNQQRSLVGGFFSLAALRAMTSALLPGLDAEGASRLERAPHRGLSPIVYGVSQAGDGTPISIQVDLGRESLEDLSFVLATTPEVQSGSVPQVD